MPPTQVHHIPSSEFRPDAAVPGYIEHRGDQRLPPSVAVPLIAGLSAALWAAIWCGVRGMMGS